MRRRHYIGIIYLVLTGIVISSCHKEYFQLEKLSDEMEFRPAVVAPLIHGSMSMNDIVSLFDSAGYVGEFADGLIFLAYSDTLANLTVDTLSLLGDAFYDEIFLSPEIGSDPGFIGSGIGDTIHFVKSNYFSANAEGETRLDSIFFKDGNMLLEVASTFRHRGMMTISSEYLQDPGGSNYSRTIEISSVGGDFTGSESHSLDAYSLHFVTQGDSTVFRIDYDLALINSGNPISPGELCEINISMLDLGFYSLFGYIDPQTVVSDSGELDIPIFADFPELSHLKLADPRINIRTESSLGIPFELTLDSVIATAEDGATETLEIYEGHPFKISAPSFSNMGATVESEIQINNITSNFHDLLNLAPHNLSYRVTGGADPDIPDQNHFLLDSSRFMLEAEFLLPLDLRITGYALEDTLEFELGEEGVDTSLIRNVVVTVNTVNELPVELSMQLYLLDEFHQVLDSIFDGEEVFLPASEVDNSGLLLSASEKSNAISFPVEKLGKLEQVRYMQVRARLVTSGLGQEYVKFYSDYSLEFEISMYADFIINTRKL
jgi:hypothetical protein